MLLNTLGRLHQRGDPGKEKGGGKSLSVPGLARLHGSKGEQGPNHHRDWGPAKVTQPQPAGAAPRELVHKPAQVETELFPTEIHRAWHSPALAALQHPGQDSSTELMLLVLRSSTRARTKGCSKSPAGAEPSPYPRPVASKQLHKGTQDCRERLPR